MEKDVENSTVAALTEETSAVVAASTNGASDREVPVPILSDHSNEDDFIDDSDTDPTFSLPVKPISQPLVPPRRLSSSSSSSSSSAVTEKNRNSVHSMEKKVENSTTAALINEPSAVAASGDGASDREVPVPILSDNSDEEDSIDDSDTDPTFCVPMKLISRPLVPPRRLSSSSSSSSSSSNSSSSSRSSDDESNRPGTSTLNTQGINSNSTLTHAHSCSCAIDSAQSVSEPRVSRKRKLNPAGWKSKIAKTLRNSGKTYVSLTNRTKQIPERQIRPPCGDKCKLNIFL